MPPKASTERYTPHGYLANPHHSTKLSRTGVVRSAEPLGFALWYPNHPGAYGRAFGYCAELNLALSVGKHACVSAGDLADLHAPVHTTERFTYSAQAGNVRLNATYMLVRKGLLRAVVRLKNTSGKRQSVRLYGLGKHVRNGAFSGLWEEGLVARVTKDGLELKAHPEGVSVALTCDVPCDRIACFDDIAQARRAIAADPSLAGQRTHVVKYGGGENAVAGAIVVLCDLPAGASRTVVFSMAWSDVDAELAQLVATPAKATTQAIAAKTAADEEFDAEAIGISGDWPESWRRGLYYDIQTLRMCILPPRGVFNHPWDAMQIQASRFVLAETTFDMFLHGYSRVKQAQDIVLGSMLDAPEPWMPCIREDGSANMIAWDGHPCGTAPEWGVPAWVIERLYRRRPDRAWLAKVLAPLTTYLEWWDANRVDRQGFAHYQCSYESGQDMSPRFNPQKGGGDDTTHCRAVDVQAAMVDSWRFVADAQALLGDRAAAGRARKQAQFYKTRLDKMWHENWYHDYSTKKGGFTSLKDCMQLYPFFYGLGTEAKAKAVRPWVADQCVNQPPPVWPTFMLTISEGAYQVGCTRELSRLIEERIGHVYSALDAWKHRKNMPLPGVQHEYWPSGRPAWGAEGYGWGTFSIALLVRYLAGWREDGPLDSSTFTLAPALPPGMVKSGKVLNLHNLPALSHRFDLSYTCGRGGALGLRLASRKNGTRLTMTDEQGRVLAGNGGSGELTAQIANHQRYRVVVGST